MVRFFKLFVVTEGTGLGSGTGDVDGAGVSEKMLFFGLLISNPERPCYSGRRLWVQIPFKSKILMGLNLMIPKTMFQEHLSGSVGMSRNHKEVHLTYFKDI